MKSKTLFLVCNAHLDPVWLWEWEEGLAETLSTFRTAAKFCKEFDGFIFCHNEAVLYQWIEEYDRELFKDIRELVRLGKWHIMGGWYLQSDCNMPSGESFVRQILRGKFYFKKKFDVEPKTAINFDPFGHTRGLVQILKKSGYTSYLFCRPDEKSLPLPGNDFIWQGYDGSKILARRAVEHYNSEKGRAGERIEEWLKSNPEVETGILLWGIGNHGGGPSRVDLQTIEKIQKETKDRDIRHGTPEQYFEWLETRKTDLPEVATDLNPWAVGCYISMALIKQNHRRLENVYFLTEKILSHAALSGLMDYPGEELVQALEDLLFCQFHDILPGSSIQPDEEYALQRMAHGMEILSRLKTKAFFSLLSGHETAAEGEFPLFVYNPHPYQLEETFEIEFQPPEPNFKTNVRWQPEIFDEDGRQIPLQVEKELSNIQNDHRKRVVFRGKLKPFSMNRFRCFLRETGKGFEQKKDTEEKEFFHFQSDQSEVSVNRLTGLIDSYKVDGIEYFKSGAMQLLVIKDYPDPWGMKVRSFRNMEGAFQLLNEEEAADFAGVNQRKLAPVRIIENGPIRTVVEALFKYNHSFAVVRYFIPQKGSEIGIDVRVFWLEKDRLLKLAVPTIFEKATVQGEVAYGVEKFDRESEELVAQKWIGIVSSEKEYALTIINNGTYGFDFKEGEVRLSLLRSAAYAAHPIDNHIPILLSDRFEPRIDQGERRFKFWITGGNADERMKIISREAQVKNEFPVGLCCFPSGAGKPVLPAVILSNDTIQLSTLKMAEEQDWLILRLFEPTGKSGETTVSIPLLDLEIQVSLEKFEIKTLAVDLNTRDCFEVDLLEQKVTE